MDQYVDDAHGVARSVFAGLAPRILVDTDEPSQSSARGRVAKGMFATGSVILAGSMAAMGLTGPVSAAEARPAPRPKGAFELGKTLKQVLVGASTSVAPAAATEVAPAPMLYRVEAGDSISSIAGRYGLSTASVLALNGLGWSSLIFPGQELKLSTSGTVAPVEPEAPTPSGRYTIVSGDTISGIADRFGVSTLSVLTANGLGWSSLIYPGQTLAIPGLVGPGTPSGDDGGFVPVVSAAPLEEVAPVEEVAPPAAPAEPVAPAPAPVTTSYTIVSGDTLSSIAARFGVSTQAILDANGLDWSSTIFPGGTLTIPSGGSVAPAGVSGSTMNDEMRANAAVIVQVGRDLGVSDYGIVIALATAMQESSLRNLTWGDRDSVGLFQQRPSTGWGTVDELTDPARAAELFYVGRSGVRGLLDISGWESMSVTQAAQRVQISAYPDAYAKWEASARQWLAELS